VSKVRVAESILPPGEGGGHLQNIFERACKIYRIQKPVVLMAPVLYSMNCLPVFESSPAAYGQLRLFGIIGKQLDVNVKI
jgi:hypothetical protein